MKITTSQLRQIIREEIQTLSLKEAWDTNIRKPRPISPVTLQKVFDYILKVGGFASKTEANAAIKELTQLPDLINKAIGGDKSANAKLATGLKYANSISFKSMKTKTPSDKEIKKYFSGLGQLVLFLDRAMRAKPIDDNNFSDISKKWGDVKWYIESVLNYRS